MEFERGVMKFVGIGIWFFLISKTGIGLNGQLVDLAPGYLSPVVMAATGAFVKETELLDGDGLKKVSTVLANAVYFGEGKRGSLLLTSEAPFVDAMGEIKPNQVSELSLRFGATITSFRKGVGSPRKSYSVAGARLHTSQPLTNGKRLVVVELPYSWAEGAVPTDRKMVAPIPKNQPIPSKANLISFGYGHHYEEPSDGKAQWSEFQRALTSGFLTFAILTLDRMPSSQDTISLVPGAKEAWDAFQVESPLENGFFQGPCSNDEGAPLFLSEDKVLPPVDNDSMTPWKPVTVATLIGIHIKSDGTCRRKNSTKEAFAHYVDLRSSNVRQWLDSLTQ